MKRVKTGIRGLDPLMDGGLPDKSSLLICGPPGVGKSIFGIEFLYHGAQAGEAGLYVSIEEKPQNLRDQALQFGMDLAKMEKSNKIRFLKIPIDEVNVDIMSIIEKEALKIKAKRIVIDSLSILSINAPMYRLPIKVTTDEKFARADIQPSTLTGNEEVQQFIYIFISRVNDLGATSLFIADSPQNENYLTRDTVSEFAADGVIQLKTLTMGKTVHRTLEIKKLRKTKITPGINLIDFDSKGLVVKEFEY